MSLNTHRACLLLLLAAMSGALHAQTQRSGGGSESQKILQQYQQLAGEKTALQAQVTQMKQQLDAAKTELAAVQKERDALKARSGAAGAAAAQLAALRESSERAAEQNRQKMTEVVARFRETVANLKEIETNRNKLQEDLRVRNELYDRCAADNLSLFEVNDDLLNRYEHVGLFTKASVGEPFTRITRARIDNLVDEYRQRALELRAKARDAASTH
jgi:chromosome segregation ATPase